MIATSERAIHGTSHILHAVIGVWFDGERTFYVRRSLRMENYPGTWSLFSIQYDPAEMPDSLELEAARRIMERMSTRRLCGAPIRVHQFLTGSTCTANPINKIVNLRLYRVEFDKKPRLNPDYYVDSAWMTPEEYLTRRGNTLCGSCIQAWSDYLMHRASIKAADAKDVLTV